MERMSKPTKQIFCLTRFCGEGAIFRGADQPYRFGDGHLEPVLSSSPMSNRACDHRRDDVSVAEQQQRGLVGGRRRCSGILLIRTIG